MKPAELSEPGSSTNEIQTDDFDVSEELGRLDRLTDDDTTTESSSKTPSKADSTNHNIQEETSKDATSQTATSGTLEGLIKRIRSLF